MAVATEIMDVELSTWIGGVKFYGATDGKYFVVDADIAGPDRLGSSRIVRRPTVIYYTDSAAVTEDLTADFMFDPGTSHEEAVIAAGYQLEV